MDKEEEELISECRLGQQRLEYICTDFQSVHVELGGNRKQDVQQCFRSHTDRLWHREPLPCKVGRDIYIRIR